METWPEIPEQEPETPPTLREILDREWDAEIAEEKQRLKEEYAKNTNE